MKRYIPGTLSIVLGIVLLTLAFTEGCANTAIQSAAYTSLATLGNAVNAAEQGYMDLIVKGTISTNSLAGESAAYNKFQSDFGIAVSLVSGSTTNAAPPALLTEGNAFVQSVATLQTGK